MEIAYQHSPLSGPRATRLIYLRTGVAEDEPLTCEIKETSVDHPDPYVALSYTWGNQGFAVPLAVLGHAGEQTMLRVTPNCADALNVLRRSDLLRDRGLWVDAICIDQGSNQDKSIQVTMMADIYRAAEAVAIWLGRGWAPESHDTLAPVVTESVAKACDIDGDALGWRGTKRSRTRYTALQQAVKDSDKAILMRMIEAPYWKRAWTLQESGNLSAVILCQDAGCCPALAAWNVLQHLAPVFSQMHGLDLHLKLFPKPTRQAAATTEPLLERLLLRINATDPRDKVYAFKSLYPHSLGKVAVDYSRSVESIFSEATRQHITAHSSLGILYEAAGHPTQRAGLPSWALDWAFDYTNRWDQVRPGDWHMLKSARASRSSKPLFRFSQGGTKLYLTGRRIAIVRNHASVFTPNIPGLIFAGQLNKPGEYLRTQFAILRVLSDFILAEPAGSTRLDTAEQKFEALRRLVMWRLKLADDFVVNWATRMVLALFLFEKRVDIRHTLERVTLDENATKVISDAVTGGMLFQTAEGRFGLGYCAVEAGDVVCVFAGLKMPFIIRPLGSSYRLVGCAYVDGAMKGEHWTRDEGALEEWEIV